MGDSQFLNTGALCPLNGGLPRFEDVKLLARTECDADLARICAVTHSLLLLATAKDPLRH